MEFSSSSVVCRKARQKFVKVSMKTFAKCIYLKAVTVSSLNVAAKF